MASAIPVFATDWDHSNAIYWLWDTEAEKESFSYENRQRVGAATFCVAESHVSRKFALSLMEDLLFKVLIDANTQLTG